MIKVSYNSRSLLRAFIRKESKKEIAGNKIISPAISYIGIIPLLIYQFYIINP